RKVLLFLERERAFELLNRDDVALQQHLAGRLAEPAALDQRRCDLLPRRQTLLEQDLADELVLGHSRPCDLPRPVWRCDRPERGSGNQPVAGRRKRIAPNRRPSARSYPPRQRIPPTSGWTQPEESPESVQMAGEATRDPGLHLRPARITRKGGGLRPAVAP